MTEIVHYSLETILKTKFENTYVIAPDIKKILDMLETHIVVPTETYDSTSSNVRRNDKSFDRNQRGNSHMRGGRRGGSNPNSRNSSSDNLNTIMDDWNAVRNFTATDIVKAV